jgi:Tol biopolymer transport system component
VFTVDAGTSSTTLLGTVAAHNCDPDRLFFQWAPDRVHVLMTGPFGQVPYQLDAPTAAGRELMFICCDLPTDVWQGGASGNDGWVLSPNGDKIAAVHTSSIGNTGIADGIVVANIDGSGETTLLLPRGADMGGSGLSWSPDESAVVVAACLPCNQAGRGQPPSPAQVGHLFVIPIDGSPVRDVVSSNPGAVGSVAWSPDGTRFAAVRAECQLGEAMPFCSIPGMTFSLELVDATNGTERVLVTGEQIGDPLAQIMAPMWFVSLGGARIAFSTFVDPSGPSKVFVVGAASGDLTDLGEGSLLGWSPDGQWLLVVRRSQPDIWTDMWAIKADGTDARELGNFSSAAW